MGLKGFLPLHPFVLLPAPGQILWSRDLDYERKGGQKNNQNSARWQRSTPEKAPRRLGSEQIGFNRKMQPVSVSATPRLCGSVSCC
jgi:hypothetical protein